jgi:glutamate N-acetyltransferase/amino-acid N-acetyltransferase
MNGVVSEAGVQSAIQQVKGFQVAGVACGIKKNDALDFALFVSDVPCAAAGVFTKNEVKAAPLLVDMEHLEHSADRIHAVAINSGCANACTGQQGLDNARQTARWIAEKIGCAESEVLVLSTGVIGAQLPMDRIKRGVELAVDALGDQWELAARAIMTTDTRPKLASLGGGGYTIAGVSKGAGMIAPNMATMLSVVVTDAVLPVHQVSSALKYNADVTYNRIVIDGDTSTNDTVFLLANGASGVRFDDAAAYHAFKYGALNQVCAKLSKDIVRDGEGVTKFITIVVDGAPDDESAHRIANTIAISPLVKTAFFGEDANWGRLVMAAGRAGVPVSLPHLSVSIVEGETPGGANTLALLVGGQPAGHSEERASEIMRASSICVALTVGRGEGKATVWTCDLSHDYVSINADYRS